jgi:hypothetical protein
VFVENGLGKNALALVGAAAKGGRCGMSGANGAMKPKGGTPDIATRSVAKGNALYPAMRKLQERRVK